MNQPPRPYGSGGGAGGGPGGSGGGRRGGQGRRNDRSRRRRPAGPGSGPRREASPNPELFERPEGQAFAQNRSRPIYPESRRDGGRGGNGWQRPSRDGGRGNGRPDGRRRP